MPVPAHFRSLCTLFTALCCLLLAGTTARAVERVVTNPVESALDRRFDYQMALLRQAMERTVDSHGPYTIERHPVFLSRNRALKEVEAGRITVFEAPTRSEWEEALIPVRVPLRRGILGYKLFLIRAEDQPAFAKVRTLDDLEAFRMGQGSQWTVTLALRKLGFSILGSDSYEQLFDLLMKGRIDYFPRSINEVFVEHEDRRELYPNMAVERALALYLPLPSYFFVSPDRPDLAERLEAGLMAMMEDGSFERTFREHNQEYLAKAKLGQRRVFRLSNPDLPMGTPLETKSFWHTPGPGK